MTLVTALIVTMNFAFADLTFLEKAKDLRAAWAKAQTEVELDNCTSNTYEALKHEAELKAMDPAGLAAVVQLLGELYARNLDPLDDALALFRKYLRSPANRHAFEAEVGQLPAERAAALRDGLKNLPRKGKN